MSLPVVGYAGLVATLLLLFENLADAGGLLVVLVFDELLEGALELFDGIVFELGLGEICGLAQVFVSV